MVAGNNSLVFSSFFKHWNIFAFFLNMEVDQSKAHFKKICWNHKKFGVSWLNNPPQWRCINIISLVLQGSTLNQKGGVRRVPSFPIELCARAKQYSGSNELHLIFVMPMVELTMLWCKHSEVTGFSTVSYQPLLSDGSAAATLVQCRILLWDDAFNSVWPRVICILSGDVCGKPAGEKG